MIWKKIILASLITIFSLGILTHGVFSRSYHIEEGTEQVYESKLFNGQTIEIDIQVPQSELQTISCTTTINQQPFSNVSVHFVQNQIILSFGNDKKNQTCWGLDSLVLNRTDFNFQDVKQLFIYNMFEFLQMPASKTALANVSINGVSQGSYIAMEGVNKSFLQRNFGTDAGQIYYIENNPKISNATGTQIEDYQVIWQNAVTKSTQSDQKRLVKALEQVNKGNLAAVDISILCKYMAVQTFASEMTENYYLYEQDGKLAILPLDTIHKITKKPEAQSSIDSPIVPENVIFSVILNNQQTRALYYDYLYALSTDYLQNGVFTQMIAHLKRAIGQLESVETLEVVTYQRAQNVLSQLQQIQHKK